MVDALEFTAVIDKVGDRYKATCPEVGLSLTSKSSREALSVLHRWTRALVDPIISKDLVNT